jgi:FkbM family methyltransferase
MILLEAERLRSLGKKLPYPLKSSIKWTVRQPARSKHNAEVARARYRIDAAGRSGSTVRLLDYQVRINQGVAPSDLYEDIFVNRVYDFESDRTDPLILDCGSNIGMSVLFFKHRYPNSRIVAFEPDPTILNFLHENIALNNLEDVDVVNAALAAREGSITLNSDGGAASHLVGFQPDGSSTEWVPFVVPCVRLSDYVTENVDFMKMNIEGAEYEVLAECEPVIRRIHQMNIEYHRLPGVPCTLHAILDLLHRNGFTYVVSDFGIAMYGSARPPANVDPDTMYWRQIFARQID